jgi:hypothetical protein
MTSDIQTQKEKKNHKHQEGTFDVVAGSLTITSP